MWHEISAICLAMAGNTDAEDTVLTCIFRLTSKKLKVVDYLSVVADNHGAFTPIRWP
jgi:hypothetical protein